MQQRLRTVLPLLLVAALGLGVSVTIEQVHRELARDASYVSFCSVSSRINCDVVLASPYAKAFGASVSLWACLFYAGILMVGAAILFTDSFTQRRRLVSILFGASILGLLFSIYMAYIAFFVLNTVCLLCSALYLVSIALFALVWRMRGQLDPPKTKRAANHNDRAVLIGSAIAAGVLILLAMWETMAPGSATTAEAIKKERPDFYQWFFERPVMNVSVDGGNIFGANDAPVTIVEFSDFGCGHCAAFDRTLAQVLRSGQNKQVRVIYRHFPLDSECNPAMQQSAHPYACLAAAAAECAAEQGEFWRYHQVLFENQNRFKRSELLEYARDLDLDLGKFETCLQSDEARKRVARDAAEGVQLKIQSTPTFFINGRKIEGALDPQRLTDALTLAQSAR